MMKSLSILWVPALLAGCAFNGFTDSNTDFGCRAPDGVSCNSVSGIYANAMANNLPAQRMKRHQAQATETSENAEGSTGTSTPTTTHIEDRHNMPMLIPGLPIRAAETQLRIWVAPWQDEEKTLHDQSYMYIVGHSAEWRLAQTRKATTERVLSQRCAPVAPTHNPMPRQMLVRLEVMRKVGSNHEIGAGSADSTGQNLLRIG
jgi:conjugal transfer pilus assembly protein TraV